MPRSSRASPMTDASPPRDKVSPDDSRMIEDAIVVAAQLPRQPCERCGALGVDAYPHGSVVMFVCPLCRHEEERMRLPFFSVTGPSGSGKSTLVRRLWRELPECVVLDGDVLWNPTFWEAREAFYTLWLSLSAQISFLELDTTSKLGGSGLFWELRRRGKSRPIRTQPSSKLQSPLPPASAG